MFETGKRHPRRRFASCEDGVATVEFALVLPILLLVLLAMIDLHLYLTTHRRLDHAARAAALKLSQDRDANVTTAELSGAHDLIDAMLAPFAAGDVAITIASYARADDTTTQLWQATRAADDGALAAVSAPSATGALNGRSAAAVGLNLKRRLTIGFLPLGGRIAVEADTAPIHGVALERGP